MGRLGPPASSYREGHDSDSQDLAAYDELREARRTFSSSPTRGDPAASARAILEIVDAPAPPLRAFLGSGPLGIAEADYASRLELWCEWQPVAELAQG